MSTNTVYSPLLICISRTRNYGWITRAFLEGNSRWADYIIITDQMSTDGTREMCAEYENVILIDDYDMSFKENSGFKMAFLRGREIAKGRDAIYFAMDIDEVMPANWRQTKDGKKILQSEPGDMFSIAWANIQPNNRTYHDEREMGPGKYTVFHDNGMDWQKCTRELHTPHLPYSSWDIEPYAVKDFPILHFGWYHPRFNKYKAVYHQCLDVHLRRSKSPVALMRNYIPAKATRLSKLLNHKVQYTGYNKVIDQQWLFSDFDLFRMIDMSTQPMFIMYIQELISQDGIKRYGCLDVWDEDLMSKLGVSKDPRPLKWRIIHRYLRASQPYKQTFFVRAMDKLLKTIL